MSLPETLALLMFGFACAGLMAGYNVAFTLSGVSLIFAAIGILTGTFDASFLSALPGRIYPIITREILMAVPLFVFMGVMLEKSRIAEDLLEAMGDLFGSLRGGLGMSVIFVGALLAASTGIVGATVVTMGLLSLPTMLKRNYSPSLASGAIAASGTLGQIIPPSIVLVILGDQMSNAFQEAQRIHNLDSNMVVSVGDLFAGALIPGLLLVFLYALYIAVTAFFNPDTAPAEPWPENVKVSTFIKRTLRAMLPPIFLIIAVLGSILSGYATPTRGAALGALGAILLATYRLSPNIWAKRAALGAAICAVLLVTMDLTGIDLRLGQIDVTGVEIGATVFSLVFRGFGGEELVASFLSLAPGGKWGALALVMLVMFVLGFFLDFIEITFVVVPLVAPPLLGMGIDPIWLGVLMALNLQTSFLTPPFGFALFYLRGVAPPELTTRALYKGVIPFIFIQFFVIALVVLFPQLATGLVEGNR